jgi:hypothetical protein
MANAATLDEISRGWFRETSHDLLELVDQADDVHGSIAYSVCEYEATNYFDVRLGAVGTRLPLCYNCLANAPQDEDDAQSGRSVRNLWAIVCCR